MLGTCNIARRNNQSKGVLSQTRLQVDFVLSLCDHFVKIRLSSHSVPK